MLHRAAFSGVPYTKGRNQMWPTKRRKCYINRVFSGVPNQGDKVKGGPQVGGSATSPLCSWGSPDNGTKSKVAHKSAEVLHHPRILGGPPGKGSETKLADKRAEVPRYSCVLRGPQTRGQNQRWPGKARNCYITPRSPCVLRVPLEKGTETNVRHKRAELPRHPCVVRAPQTTKQGDKVKGGPQVGTRATSTCVLWNPVQKGTETKGAHKWAEVLHHPCHLRVPK